MGCALIAAARAEAEGEVPVGAVLVKDQRCVAEGWNRPILDRDPTAHAEIVALRAAARVLDNYRLPGTTLYVTLEPCIMCLGAMIHARVGRLVYGAPDALRGAAGSMLDLTQSATLNHRMMVSGNVLADQCSTVLKAFFQRRR